MLFVGSYAVFNVVYFVWWNQGFIKNINYDLDASYGNIRLETRLNIFIILQCRKVQK